MGGREDVARETASVVAMRLGRGSLVMPAGALAAARFLAEARLAVAVVAGAAAEASTLLLVPGAEGLAAKRQVVVLDDGRLDPGVRIEVNLAGGGIEGAEVRHEVIGVGGFGRGGRHHHDGRAGGWEWRRRFVEVGCVRIPSRPRSVTVAGFGGSRRVGESEEKRKPKGGGGGRERRRGIKTGRKDRRKAACEINKAAVGAEARRFLRRRGT